LRCVLRSGDLPPGGDRKCAAEVAAETGLTASGLAAIFRRGAYASGCWVQGGEGDWLIEHVATQPAYRGRGLCAGPDRPGARKRKTRRLFARIDLLSDRQ
jgi:hypothetical protein